MNLSQTLPLFLAQTTDSTLNAYAAQQPHFNPLASLLSIIIGSVIGGLFWWGVFTKAGFVGWKSMIPFYNTYCICKIAGMSPWWLLAIFIPIINFIGIFVFLIIMAMGLSKNFGQGGGTTVGLIFLPFIFVPILGYGSARYIGNSGAGTLSGGSAPYPTV